MVVVYSALWCSSRLRRWAMWFNIRWRCFRRTMFWLRGVSMLRSAWSARSALARCSLLRNRLMVAALFIGQMQFAVEPNQVAVPWPAIVRWPLRCVLRLAKTLRNACAFPLRKCACIVLPWHCGWGRCCGGCVRSLSCPIVRHWCKRASRNL